MPQDATIHVRTGVYPAGTPIAGAYVGLHNSSSGAFISYDTSDASGNVVFPALAAGTYEIRINLNTPGTVTNGNVQNITVEDPVVTTNTFDIQANITSLPTSSDTRLCKLSGYVVDLSGQPLKNVKIHFREHLLPHATYYSGSNTTKGVIPKEVTVTSDSNGYVVVELIRGAKYASTVTGFGNYTFLVEVPDASSVDIIDVLFPIVETVEYYNSGVLISPVNAPSITLGNLTTTELTTKVYLRNGIEVGAGLVELTSSDTTKLTVGYSASEVTKGGTLTLTTLGTGTVTVTVARKSNDVGGTSFSPEPDIVSNLTVVIS